MCPDRKAQEGGEGAKPKVSLGLTPCPSRMTRVMIRFSDFSLYVSLKIEGRSIPRVVKGRRAVSFLRRLGFEQSAAFLEGQLSSRGRGRRRTRSLGLDLQSLPELPFASVDVPGEKSSMLVESPEVKA